MKCLQVYSDSKALKAHIESIHKKSQELHCSLCCRIFSSKYALNRHKNEVGLNIFEKIVEEKMFLGKTLVFGNFVKNIILIS